MKNRLKQLFSISRSERIGLTCITVLIAGVIALNIWSGKQESTSSDADQAKTTSTAACELAVAIDSAKTDTVPRKRRKKAQKVKKERIILTASSLQEVEHER